MGYGLVADEGSVYVEKEVTEGEYVAETEGASALEVLSDGLEFTPSKELLERNNRTATVEKVPARVGQKSMAGSIPIEYRAGSAEGDAPEANDLYEAMLGGKRVITSTISDTGHTVSRIQLADGDGAKYKIHDIVKIKEFAESGAEDHVSPITGKSETPGDNYIDLLVPMGAAPSDNVEVAPVTMYFHQSGAPTVSVTNYLGGQIREKAIGMRVTSAEISNFSTGQLPQVTFAMEGLNYEREVGTPLFASEFDSSLPPVVLCSKIYQDDVELVLNNFGMTMTNTLGFLTSTASCQGKISSRITELVTTFSANPYMEDDDVEQFEKFDKNTAFSIFGSSHNPGATSKDEHLEIVAFYMPNCRSTEITTGDEDGILTDAISGQAYKSNGNDSVFLAFI